MPLDPLSGLKRAQGISAGPLDNLGPVTQSVMPMLPGGLLGPLKGLFGAKPPVGAPPVSGAMETLGETNPEYTPTGGEGIYNVARTGLKAMADPVEAAYKRILGGMGK